MWVLSCFFLSIVFVLCLAGALSHAYDDNLMQRIAMGLMAIATASRIESIWRTQYVANDWILFHAGAALFAIGVAVKVIAAKRERTRFGQTYERRKRTIV